MTAKDAVLDLLKKDKQLEEGRKDDAETQKSEWLEALKALLDQFRRWTAGAEAEKLLNVSEFVVSINEQQLGAYEAPALKIITPRGLAVNIRPKARFVVGAAGRVEFDAVPKSASLVRISPGHWQFAKLTPEQGGWTFRDLDEEAFWQTLKDLLQ